MSGKIGLDINMWNFLGFMFDIDLDAEIGYKVPLFKETTFYGAKFNPIMRLGGVGTISAFILDKKVTVYLTADIAEVTLMASIKHDIVNFNQACWALDYDINTFNAAIKARWETNECDYGALGMYFQKQGLGGDCTKAQYDIDIID
jgi:hypothetical protein